MTLQKTNLRVWLHLPDGGVAGVTLELVVPPGVHHDEVVMALFPHLIPGPPPDKEKRHGNHPTNSDAS